MAIVDDQFVPMTIAPVPKHDDTFRFADMGIVLAQDMMLVLDFLGVVLRPQPRSSKHPNGREQRHH